MSDRTDVPERTSARGDGAGAPMKVVALVPFKNEEWILPAYLTSMEGIADEIVGLDDDSTDSSRQLIERAGGHVCRNKSQKGVVWTDHSFGKTSRMTAAWRQLLEIGRSRGGTHFLCLDADEALTAPARAHLRGALARLAPGQKLAMQWLTLWKRRDEYRADEESAWTNLYKDFAFVDADGTGEIVGIGRTAGPNAEAGWLPLPPEQGAVLHYQFVPWRRNQVKRAWYQCAELIGSPGWGYEINRTYSIYQEAPGARTLTVPPEWLDGITAPERLEDVPPSWHLETVLGWFDRYGIEFFEPLEIWDVPPFRERFLVEIGRDPHPVTRPQPARRFAGAIYTRLSGMRRRIGSEA